MVPLQISRSRIPINIDRSLTVVVVSVVMVVVVAASDFNVFSISVL